MLIFFIPILVLVFLQVWACSSPLFGHFGSYQAMNAMFAEMMHGNDVLSWFSPKSFILIDGMPSLHLLYYPFGSAFARLLQLGIFSNDWIPFFGKFQAVLCMGFSAWILYRIARRSYSKNESFWTVWAFLFSPMIMISGVSFQNEAPAILFLVLAVEKILGKQPHEIRWHAWLMAGIFLGLSVVARVHFAALILVFLFMALKRKTVLTDLVLLGIGFLIPIGAWVGWFYQLSVSGQSVQTSLFSQSGEGRILAASLFQDLEFYKRLLKEILCHWTTPFLLPFFLWGVFQKSSLRFTFLVWLASGFAVVLLLPQKVMDHPFYLIANIPAVAFLAGPILNRFFESRSKWALVFVVAASLFSIKVFFGPAFHVSDQAYHWIKTARWIQSVTRLDEKIVLQHPQTAAMQYYTHRFGWGLDLDMQNSWTLQSQQSRHLEMKLKGYGNLASWIEYLRSQGAETLVITEPEAFKAHPEFFQKITNSYALRPDSQATLLIYDLRKK